MKFYVLKVRYVLMSVRPSGWISLPTRKMNILCASALTNFLWSHGQFLSRTSIAWSVRMEYDSVLTSQMYFGPVLRTETFVSTENVHGISLAVQNL
mgnify:CR=1 FL=1